MRAAPMRVVSSRSGKAPPTRSARSVSALSIDCFRRAAALPVGAASAMRWRAASGAVANSSASSRATVYVLPVPGPPVMMANAPRRATAQAIRCQSGVSPARWAPNSASSHVCAWSMSTSRRSCARVRTHVATSVSSRQ